MISDPLWLLLIGIVVVAGGILALRLHAFLALTLAAMIVGGLTPSSSRQRFAEERKLSPAETRQLVEQPLGKRVAREFGNTCGSIGIMIALASIVGKCLLESGAADRIVRSAMRLLGEGRAPLAFLGSGFLLGIPVFFDTVFYLLIPLGKALRLRTGRNYALYVMTIIAGTTMAHSLVPPTPGPLFVADKLGVGIGMMMLGGTVVGLITCVAGYAYAVWLNRRLEIPLRESTETSLDDLSRITQRDERELPSLWSSILPILLPVALIAAGAAASIALDPDASGWRAAVRSVTALLGEANAALAVATAVALWLVVQHRPQNQKPLATALQEALAGGGLIILITAAGGAFGAMLQQTGIGNRIEGLASAYQVGILPLAYFVTALVRTAQGSATVAMITAVGMLATLVRPEELGFHPVYVALAIGCGSKPFPWMNDSGFWVINRMSGMTLPETIKTFSVLVTLMSLAGLAALIVLARLFPLV
jgi:GntP family gluconate:H+ symporter